MATPLEEGLAPPAPGWPRRRRDGRVAIALSLVPGLGQAYNGQWGKALYFFGVTLFTIGPSVLLLMAGEHVGADLLRRRAFVLFLVVAFGSVLVFLALFVLGLALWAAAAVDARRSAKEISQGRSSGDRWWFLHLG